MEVYPVGAGRRFDDLPAGALFLAQIDGVDGPQVCLKAIDPLHELSTYAIPMRPTGGRHKGLPTIVSAASVLWPVCYIPKAQLVPRLSPDHIVRRDSPDAAGLLLLVDDKVYMRVDGGMKLETVELASGALTDPRGLERNPRIGAWSIRYPLDRDVYADLIKFPA